MTDIIRTWHCLNSRCDAAFDAWEPNPSCPHCGCVRVSWIPGGGHVAGTGAKTADAELRALADVFRMTDMNSAERGRGAKKVATPAATSGQPMQFAPGFAAAVHPDRAVCVPSAQNVNFKAKMPVGTPLTPNRNMPAMSSNTLIEATHRAKP